MNATADNIITAGSGPLAQHLNPLSIARTLWRHRDLVRQMTWRNVLARYRGSALGIAWSFIIPLLMLVVYTFVFGVVFKGPRWPGSASGSIWGYALVIYSGLLVYNVFAETISAAPTLIINNPNFVKKVVFPLEILPVCLLGANLVQFLFGMFVLLTCSLLITGHISTTILLFPLVMVPLLMVTCGFTWFLSSFGVYVRDTGPIIAVLLQMMIFLSPVFYSLDQVPAAIRSLMLLNPLTAIVQNARHTLLWSKLPDWSSLALVTLIAALTMQLGYAWFMKTRRGFADVL